MKETLSHTHQWCWNWFVPDILLPDDEPILAMILKSGNRVTI